MSKTKIFFDAEFTGLHQNTTLISIGLVSECGKTFYAEFTDYDVKQVHEYKNCHWQGNPVTYAEFVKLAKGKDIVSFGSENKLNADLSIVGSSEFIKEHLTIWLSKFNEVEIWSDCLSYDWVLFCQIFGHAFNIPKNIYYIPFDISTLFYAKGIDANISRETFAEMSEGSQKHNALWDAKVIRQCFIKLQDIS